MTDAESPTCVVLAAADDPVRDSIGACLQQRGWRVRWQADPHLALADVCLDALEQRERAGWGLRQKTKWALVIAPNRANEPEVGRLRAAAARYLPMLHVLEWSDELAQPASADATHSASGHDDGPASDAPQPASRSEPPASQGTPNGDPRATQADRRDDDALNEADDEESSTRITAEELAMLLRGEAPEDDS